MQLYLTQAYVTKDITNPFWARQWDKSATDASKTRTKFVEMYELKRKDVTTIPVELDVRKDALMNTLNKIVTVGDEPLKLD